MKIGFWKKKKPVTWKVALRQRKLLKTKTPKLHKKIKDKIKVTFFVPILTFSFFHLVQLFSKVLFWLAALKFLILDPKNNESV